MAEAIFKNLFKRNFYEKEISSDSHLDESLLKPLIGIQEDSASLEKTDQKIDELMERRKHFASVPVSDNNLVSLLFVIDTCEESMSTLDRKIELEKRYKRTLRRLIQSNTRIHNLSDEIKFYQLLIRTVYLIVLLSYTPTSLQ